MNARPRRDSRPFAASPASATFPLPGILSRLRDDRELTTLKLGVLGLLVLGAAALERLS